MQTPATVLLLLIGRLSLRSVIPCEELFATVRGLSKDSSMP